jgi:HD-like signal output (HDOD) protein
MDAFRDELIAKLSMLEDLPTLPSIILELERLLHSDSVCMDTIAAVIEEDPAIAASVLRVANSPVYYTSMSGRIVSLRDAIVHLGLREVQRLVSASGKVATGHNYGRDEAAEGALQMKRRDDAHPGARIGALGRIALVFHMTVHV